MRSTVLAMSLLLLLANAGQGLYARSYAAGLRGGIALPFTDFVQEPQRHPALGITFEAGIAQNLALSAEPYFTRLCGENTSAAPLGSYEASIAGMNLMLLYKPEHSGALNLRSGILRRIAPFAEFGLGALYYDTEGEISSVPFTNRRGALVFPALGAGIALLTKWNFEAEAGFVYVYPWDDEMDNRPQNNFSDSFLMPALTLKYRFEQP